jgi:hypothetical protein
MQLKMNGEVETPHAQMYYIQVQVQHWKAHLSLLGLQTDLDGLQRLAKVSVETLSGRAICLPESQSLIGLPFYYELIACKKISMNILTETRLYGALPVL